MSQQWCEEVLKIQKLMGALDTAFFERVTASGKGFVDAYVRRDEDFLPKSTKELAVWEELTRPSNYEALKRFTNMYNIDQLSPVARNLDQALLAEAARRVAAEQSGNSTGRTDERNEAGT